MRFKFKICFAALLGSVLLSACGGSGSANAPTLPPPPPPPPPPPTNNAPVSSATANKIIIMEGQPFELDASNSSDPEGDTLTYSWSQTSGTAVTLETPSNAMQSLAAQLIEADETLEFLLTVSDGTNSSTDTVSLEVENFENVETKSLATSFNGGATLPGLKALIPTADGSYTAYWDNGLARGSSPTSSQLFTVNGDRSGPQEDGEFQNGDDDFVETNGVIVSGNVTYYMNRFILSGGSRRGLSTYREAVNREVSGFGEEYMTYSSFVPYDDYAAIGTNQVVSVFATREDANNSSYDTVAAAILQADGTSVITTLASTDPTLKTDVSVSVFSNGVVCTTWSEGMARDMGRSIKMQRLTLDGNLLSDRITVTEGLSGSLSTSITMKNGDVFVAWDGEIDGSAIGIGARIVKEDGSFSTEAFGVNAVPDGIQSRPHLTAFGEGNVLVTWINQRFSNDTFTLHGRVFDSEGNAKSNDFLISGTEGLANYTDPISTSLTDGRVILGWLNRSSVRSGNVIFGSQTVGLYPLGK